jgi:very-short-patch-repair endonuclease
VYSVGLGKLTKCGHYMAAVLAYGPDGLLSHRASADHLGLRRSTLIEVTVPRGGGRSRNGIRVHHADDLDRIVVDAIPCTTVARTIVDCAELIPLKQVENMIDRAEQLRVFDLRAVEAELNGRRGAPKVRTVLGSWHGEAGTRNAMERLLLDIVRAARLPEPHVNVMVLGEERDFVWPGPRVIVETDGRERHDTARQFEVDRRKDQAAMAAGWRVLRFTWRQLTHEPDRVAATLRAVLTRPPS